MASSSRCEDLNEYLDSLYYEFRFYFERWRQGCHLNYARPLI